MSSLSIATAGVALCWAATSIGEPVNTAAMAIAADAPQRRDLLGHRARYAGHGEIDAGAGRVARQPRGMDEKADGGARARMRVHDGLGHRQHGVEAGERLANDAGEEARGGGV